MTARLLNIKGHVCSFPLTPNLKNTFQGSLPCWNETNQKTQKPHITANSSKVELLLSAVQSTNESESHSVVFDSLQPHGLYSPWNSPGQNIGAGSHSLLQGIFPTQGPNPGLSYCRRILYSLSHQGSPINPQKT